MKLVKLSIVSVIVFLFVAGCAATPTNSSRYTVINAETAKQLFDRDAKFIDVRTKTSFTKGHIPGAMNLMPGRGFSSDRLAQLVNKDDEIVFYCYGIHCELSSRATDSAVRWGYKKVHYFVRGFPAWQESGYPVERL